MQFPARANYSPEMLPFTTIGGFDLGAVTMTYECTAATARKPGPKENGGPKWRRHGLSLVSGLRSDQASAPDRHRAVSGCPLAAILDYATHWLFRIEKFVPKSISVRINPLGEHRNQDCKNYRHDRAACRYCDAPLQGKTNIQPV